MNSKRSLKYIIVSILMIFTMIPISAYSLYTFKNKVSDYKKEFEKSVYNDLNSISLIMDNTDLNNKNILKTFLNHPYIIKIKEQELNKEEAIRVINEYESIYEQVASLALGTADGEMYSNNISKLPKNYDPRVRPWYVDTANTSMEVVISPVYKSVINNEEKLVTYSKKITDANGSILGVAGIDISLNVLDKALDNVKISKPAAIAILDKYGELIVDNNATFAKEIRKENHYQKCIWAAKNNNNVVDIHGKKYFYYSMNNKATGWYIVMLIPKSSFDYDIIKFAGVALFSIFIIYLMALVCTAYMTYKITRPVNELVKLLERVGNGNYEIDKRYDGFLPREIDNIFKTVYEMINKVKIQNEEIHSQNEEINALYEETIAMNETLNEYVDELRYTYKSTVSSLANAIEAKDSYTKGHCERVTEYCLKIAGKMDFTDKELLNLEYASLLHDIGKIGIPNSILNKEGSLTDEEYEIIKKHPEIGYEIIQNIEYLKESAKILAHHHERMDGRGYPNQLEGEAISIFSKILCVADAYDAMTSSRPYKKRPLSKEEAIQQLTNNVGIQFDKEIVLIFVDILSNENK